MQLQYKFIKSFALIENMLKIANLYHYIPIIFDKDAQGNQSNIFNQCDSIGKEAQFKMGL